MRNARISGTGAAVPSRVVPNAYFNELLGEDVDTWLRENVQIYERRWLAEDESVADLCEEAAKQAIARAGIKATDLNLIIIATDTPEYISPSTASVIQDRLGATNAGSFDVNAACAGFVSAMDTAFKYIQSDSQYKNILVIGAYAMSKYLNMKDKKTVTLFADGAGAVVLTATEDENVGQLASKQMTQGQYNEWMGIYAGGSHIPITPEVIAKGTHQLQFVKKFPKELNPIMWSSMAREMAERAGRNVEDVKMFFMTQINIHGIFEMLDMLGLPHDRAIYIMHKYGYTGSAAIPMALNKAVEENKIQRGDLITLIGSGGGLAFAGSLVIY
jgi:3-oxoacyl-[acyl-carrier-protein] synthase-3